MTTSSIFFDVLEPFDQPPAVAERAEAVLANERAFRVRQDPERRTVPKGSDVFLRLLSRVADDAQAAELRQCRDLPPPGPSHLEQGFAHVVDGVTALRPPSAAVERVEDRIADGTERRGVAVGFAHRCH